MGSLSPAQAWTSCSLPPREDNRGQRFQPPARRSCPPGLAVAAEPGVGRPKSHQGCHRCTCCRGTGLSCQLLAGAKRTGEKPQSLLEKGPISHSGYQTPACLVDWSFHHRREVYWGWRAERAISKVGVEGRGFSDIDITKNSVLCNKESSLTGVYYKMFDIFQEHDKIKTQRSLHWMFILFTRLFPAPPPPILRQCKQVTHFKNHPSAPRTASPRPCQA